VGQANRGRDRAVQHRQGPGHPTPVPRQQDPQPLDPCPTTPKRQTPWRARCRETGKRTESNPGTAPQADATRLEFLTPHAYFAGHYRDCEARVSGSDTPLAQVVVLLVDGEALAQEGLLPVVHVVVKEAGTPLCRHLDVVADEADAEGGGVRVWFV
jgi:hypothetical protein